jgi:N-acetylglucosaminyldiphosphoundecaprenol N-acetyl-beta-D-mannosaminyltransferase
MDSSPVTPRRIEILGVPVDCVSMRGALDFVDELVRQAQPAAVIAVNPEKVMKARQDPWLLDQLRQAALLLPDGIGVVWAARLLENVGLERVPGADLMMALCERSQAQGYRVFMYGASPAVNAAARATLQGTFPRLQIVGSRDGYLPQQAMAGLIDEINASGTDILFVALGSPRQEFWMSTYLPGLRVKVCQGVGGTFDVIAGTVRRAPLRWRDLNLEWAYRLLREPRRLARQVVLPKFAWRVLAERITRDHARARGST